MPAAHTRELAVYEGQECISTTEVAGDGAAVAYRQDGKLLGSFASYDAARAAFGSQDKRRRGNRD